jgi:hypothetical protein
MSSSWRAVMLGVMVTLGVVLGASLVCVSAQASNPRIGTWKLNVEKSTYSPGREGHAIASRVCNECVLSHLPVVARG